MAKQYFEDQQQFDSTTKFMAATIDEINMFLKMLSEQLESRAKYAPQREMAKWIKNDGECIAYPIQGKCGDELKRELANKGVAFISTADDTKIIIKQPDLELVTSLNERVLTAKGNYYQEIDAAKLETAIAKTDRIKDKEIITLHGLDKYQYEVLKNKCNDITRGFMVGKEEEPDGTISLSVHAQKVIVKDPEKMDLCKAFAESMLSLNGENSILKRQQVDADERLDREVASLKGCESTHYVIGVDDTSKYIEINSQGFEFHRVKFEDGKIKNMQELTVSKDQLDYEIELQKCMDKIYNKTIINDDNRIAEHLMSPKRNFETARPEKDQVQEKISRMEKGVVDKANLLVKTGPKKEELFRLPPKEAFILYQNEMIDVIDAAITGKELEGYSGADIESIKDEFVRADVDPNNYQLTVRGFRKYDIENHDAKERKAPAKKEERQTPPKEDKSKDDGERERA